MTRHRRVEQAEAPGQDSFLDVVANLVGILIILVVIVGAQTKSAVVALTIQESEPATAESAAQSSKYDVAGAARSLATLQSASKDLEQKIANEKLALAMREQERAQVQVVVSVAEQRLAEHRESLGGREQQKFDLARDLAVAKTELSRLEQATRVAGETPPPAVLEHYPTPMAKTVFGKELHFRLAHGRLQFVPWDDFIERLKADAPQQVQRLRDQTRVEEQLPPLGGFVLKYALQRVDASMQTRSGGAVSQTRVELERFVLLPVQETMGETIQQALENANSDFRLRLSEHPPGKTTLTVWVYPDSFGDFRLLKGEMFKRGYLTAARPLPEGMPIGGSPDGSRSVAE